MLFCTLSDLSSMLTEKVLIQLTDDTVPPTAVNTAVCQAVIAQASELIEGRLAGRYQDLSALVRTPLLTRICLDICTYYLYSRRNKGNIENVRARYQEALKELDTVKLGQALPPAQQTAVVSKSFRSSRRSADRIFSDEMWEHF